MLLLGGRDPRRDMGSRNKNRAIILVNILRITVFRMPDCLSTAMYRCLKFMYATAMCLHFTPLSPFHFWHLVE